MVLLRSPSRTPDLVTPINDGPAHSTGGPKSTPRLIPREAGRHARRRPRTVVRRADNNPLSGSYHPPNNDGHARSKAQPTAERLTARLGSPRRKTDRPTTGQGRNASSQGPKSRPRRGINPTALGRARRVPLTRGAEKRRHFRGYDTSNVAHRRPVSVARRRSTSMASVVESG